ncbi:MAG: hypothetical protein ABID64_00960, partial [Nitrospirota bacterium]
TIKKSIKSMKTKSLEKIAGYMICIPIFVKLLFALIFLENPGPIIILLAIPGSLYLIYGYKKFSAGKRNS